MLLAIDMGNTQTAMGLFDGDELVQSWRMPTDRSYTADEIHVRLMGFFMRTHSYEKITFFLLHIIAQKETLTVISGYSPERMLL